MSSRDANMGSFNVTECTNIKLASWDLKESLRSLSNLGSRAMSYWSACYRMNCRCEKILDERTLAVARAIAPTAPVVGGKTLELEVEAKP